MSSKFSIHAGLFICTIILLIGCGKKNDNVCMSYIKVPVLEVRGANTAMVNQEVELTAIFEVFNGCGKFGNFETTNSGNTTNVTLNAKYEGCMCTDVMLTKSGIYKFKKSQAGMYDVKFYQGDTFLTHTIIVN